MGQQLKASTDSKHRHIVFNRCPQPYTFQIIQILCYRRLLFVLTSTNKQHIVFVWCQGITDTQPYNAQCNATLLASLT
jgi:hypothetical protein